MNKMNVKIHPTLMFRVLLNPNKPINFCGSFVILFCSHESCLYVCMCVCVCVFMYNNSEFNDAG
jgi:hypothetical protein